MFKRIFFYDVLECVKQEKKINEINSNEFILVLLENEKKNNIFL